jgi:hypothetical protein
MSSLRRADFDRFFHRARDRREIVTAGVEILAVARKYPRAVRRDDGCLQEIDM